MTNHKLGLSKLEAIANPPRDNKYYLLIYGDDGRVEYGSDELIGMTREEVDAFLGPDCVTKYVGVDLEKI